jgi:SAM-dependent methyltransferase
MVLGASAGPLYGWEPLRSTTILESSARGSYPMMLADKYTYIGTEFDPEKIAEGSQPMRFADFQNLQFDGEMMDIVIASEVFEHVRLDRQGFAEIHRVLKPGGSLVLTVPYDHTLERTLQRIDTSGPEDRHLMEPEYHGGGGHTLTYRNYGRDLPDLLREVGFSVLRLHVDQPSAGLTSQYVFIARKGSCVDVSHHSMAGEEHPPLGALVPFRLFLLLKYNMKGLLRLLKQVGGGP